MSQSLAQLYIHLIFSTKNRYPFLKDDSLRERLYHYIGGICKKIDSPLLSIGGIEDHIHLLVGVSKNISLAKLVEEIKKSSSKWIKSLETHDVMLKKFYWQGGYAAFSVSYSRTASVSAYIQCQKEHHKEKSFMDELKNFYERHAIVFNEQFIF